MFPNQLRARGVEDDAAGEDAADALADVEDARAVLRARGEEFGGEFGDPRKGGERGSVSEVGWDGVEVRWCRGRGCSWKQRGGVRWICKMGSETRYIKLTPCSRTAL